MPLSEGNTTYRAAGGVIANPTGDRVLLLIRPDRDEVRLPKGHIEPHEGAEETAMREAREEAGYGDLEIVADLGEQLVTFLWKNTIVRRTEHYYLMRTSALQEVDRPKSDQQQFFTVWVPWEEAAQHLTFEAEQEWIRRAMKALKEHPVKEQISPDTGELHYALRERALQIHHRLIEAYGDREREPDRDTDPIAALVNTILSQNTSDHNRDIAFQQLRARYPTWEQVRDAPENELMTAIRPAGLAPTKAPRIKNALRAVTERAGELSLDFLRDKPLEEARGWLMSLDGVGPKTAAIVLLFSMGRPAFPVDTHVHRVTGRLGLIPKGTSREKAHGLLEALVPEALYYTFHLNVIEHGRTICVARKPRCHLCCITDLCDYYQTQVRPASEA